MWTLQSGIHSQEHIRDRVVDHYSTRIFLYPHQIKTEYPTLLKRFLIDFREAFNDKFCATKLRILRSDGTGELNSEEICLAAMASLEWVVDWELLLWERRADNTQRGTWKGDQEMLGRLERPLPAGRLDYTGQTYYTNSSCCSVRTGIHGLQS